MEIAIRNLKIKKNNHIFRNTSVVPTANLVREGEEAHGHEADCEGDCAEDHLPWAGGTQLAVGTKHPRNHLVDL